MMYPSWLGQSVEHETLFLGSSFTLGVQFFTLLWQTRLIDNYELFVQPSRTIWQYHWNTF